MRRIPRLAAPLAAATVALSAASMATATVAPTPQVAPGMTVAPSGGERMSILYETDGAVRAALGGSEAMRTLPWLFRQEPSNSGPGAQLASNDQRMVKISGTALFRKTTTEGMVAMLKGAIDRTCVTPAGVNTCGAHRVGVDEIGTEWGVGPARATEHTLIPGVAMPNPPAARLRGAMLQLSDTPYPGGGSYAQRVHFYIAPGVSTAIAVGKGADRTLGDDGKPHFRDYSGLVTALRRAGGLWLEMYHYPEGSRKRTPFNAREWNEVPVGFASFLRDRVPGLALPLPRTLMHFVMTGGATPLGAGCDEPPAGQTVGMACQWQLAQRGSFNSTMLGNGPAAFKLSDPDAATYGQQFRTYFALA